MKPSLWFHKELENDSSPEGRLEFWDVSQWPQLKAIERYIVRSGLEGYQAWGDQDTVARGPIPRSDRAGIDCYLVRTEPVYVPYHEQPGIDGNFYEITPSFIENGRGLFGIHRDANSPGSAGCIVIVNQPAWEAFEDRMLEFHALGIQQIPLMIGYS